MINQLINDEAIPLLERSMQFAARRHELIQHNIANITTPGFQPVDVSVDKFQRMLADAVQRQRDGTDREFRLESSKEVADAAGRISLRPKVVGRGITYHDRSNKDLERAMQDLAENMGAYRVASEILKSRYAIINAAISQRV